MVGVAVVGISVAVAQSQVKKSTVEGITNFAQVESTVACAGAVTPVAVAAALWLIKRGSRWRNE